VFRSGVRIARCMAETYLAGGRLSGAAHALSLARTADLRLWDASKLVRPTHMRIPCAAFAFLRFVFCVCVLTRVVMRRRSAASLTASERHALTCIASAAVMIQHAILILILMPLRRCMPLRWLLAATPAWTTLTPLTLAALRR
jgi:hypothetical protein